MNGQLFFCVLDQQLWKSDGTSKGTTLIQNLNSSNFYAFTERCVAANKFFFNKDQYLWVSDGTDAGTHQVNDNGLTGVSLVSNMASAGNNVFFNGYTDKYNYELYAGDASKINNVTSFSSVKQTKKYSSFSATVLENPIHSDLKLTITSDKNQTLNIVVTDERGLILTKQNIDVNKGTNLRNIRLLNLNTGVYLAKLSDDTGKSISIRILK